MSNNSQRKLVLEKLASSQASSCPLCELSLEPDLSILERYYKDFVNGVDKKNRIKRTSINIDIDHILPRSLGGVTELFNLQVTHRKCNQNKGNNL